jgi:hypothetical protein
MKKIFLWFAWCAAFSVQAQTPEELVRSIKSKLERVNNYSATGKMKTNVIFLKAPIAKVNVYFRKPDQLRILNEKGISFIPKGSMNMDLSQLFIDPAGFDLLDLGNDKKTGWRIIKLLPRDPASEVVLSTIYVDAAAGLIRRSSTTTRENGTFELEMSYGTYAEYGLADKVIFSFNSQEYQLSDQQRGAGVGISLISPQMLRPSRDASWPHSCGAWDSVEHPHNLRVG